MRASPFDSLAKTAAALNVGARLEMRKVIRGGLTGTKVDVITPDSPAPRTNTSPTPTRTPTRKRTSMSRILTSTRTTAILTRTPIRTKRMRTRTAAASRTATRRIATCPPFSKSFAAAPLSDAVKARSIRAFQLLGEAEAAIHSIPVENVHFHEVGAVDTIVDIVCAAAGAEMLGVDRWLASPLNVGSGTVDCQHGTLPVPAPATLALLGDAPIYAAGPPMERVTPTGAAVLRMLNVEYAVAARHARQSHRLRRGRPRNSRRAQPAPPARWRSRRDIAAPDSTEEPSPSSKPSSTTPIPQVLAYVSELLLEAGAWDVYRVAVQMKKGRTGVQITVLCRPDLVPAFEEIIFRETTTIGLHWRLENKLSLAREFVAGLNSVGQGQHQDRALAHRQNRQRIAGV